MVLVPNISISPQSITYIIVGLSLLPKFFSPLATTTSTVLVLTFWIAPFVLLPEFVKGYTAKRKIFSELPKLTLAISLICIICIIISFYWRETIYSDTRNKFINLKRSLYLIHPVLCFSWYPLVNKKDKKIFVQYFALLFLVFAGSLSIPLIINSIFLGEFLNNLTAIISGQFLDFFSEAKVISNGDTFFGENFAIKIQDECSAMPQIVISLFSSFILFLCCRIKSKKYLLSLFLLTVPLTFLTNSIRISMLGYFISIDNIETFDFWHTGGGSLIYSFIVMLFTSSIYYYLWAKENSV